MSPFESTIRQAQPSTGAPTIATEETRRGEARSMGQVLLGTLDANAFRLEHSCLDIRASGAFCFEIKPGNAEGGSVFGFARS
jgi:hypothetical protein